MNQILGFLLLLSPASLLRPSENLTCSHHVSSVQDSGHDMRASTTAPRLRSGASEASEFGRAATPLAAADGRARHSAGRRVLLGPPLASRRGTGVCALPARHHRSAGTATLRNTIRPRFDRSTPISPLFSSNPTNDST